jgi:hypothetical protein
MYRQFGFLPVAFMAVIFNLFALLALAELTGRVVIIPRFLAWFRRAERGEA